MTNTYEYELREVLWVFRQGAFAKGLRRLPESQIYPFAGDFARGQRLPLFHADGNRTV